MLLGILVRIAPVAGAGFPVGDGGMFYVMVREIQQAGMTIPAATAYNGAGIPFAYPPLGLWLMALLGNVLPVSLLDLFQWWPAICSILMLPVFYLLARRLLGSWFPAVVALGAFAMLPRSFEWFIEAAGSRAPGYLFALVADVRAAAGARHRPPAIRGRRGAGGRAGDHDPPERGPRDRGEPGRARDAAPPISPLGSDPRRRARRGRGGVGTVVACGPAALRCRAARLRGRHGQPGRADLAGVYRLLTFNFAEEPFMPWITGLAALGLAWSLARRHFFLPAWLVAVVLLDATAAPTDSTIPLALLAAVGLLEVVLPRLARRAGRDRGLGRPGAPGSRPVRLDLMALLGLAFLGGLFRPIQAGSTGSGARRRPSVDGVGRRKHEPHRRPSRCHGTLLVLGPGERVVPGSDRSRERGHGAGLRVAGQ
jgi:hypothetical protein